MIPGLTIAISRAGIVFWRLRSDWEGRADADFTPVRKTQVPAQPCLVHQSLVGKARAPARHLFVVADSLDSWHPESQFAPQASPPQTTRRHRGLLSFLPSSFQARAARPSLPHRLRWQSLPLEHLHPTLNTRRIQSVILYSTRSSAASTSHASLFSTSDFGRFTSRWPSPTFR
jgi:hypothetical protein